MAPNDELLSCRWARTDTALRRYHDEEWGRAVHDSRALWEKLMLDGFQAGLAWRTILVKRDSFRSAFAGFNPAVVAHFDERDVARLMSDKGIVRSHMKIQSTIRNARVYLAMQDAGEDFAELAWAGVGGRTLMGDGTGNATRSAAGDALSAVLKARGFSFVGPVIVHAWMQATGLIDDHEADCHRRNIHAGESLRQSLNLRP